MSIDYIITAAEDIRKNFGGRNIYETAENSGAKVWFRPLGQLKGFYVFENGRRYIVVNNQLNESMRRLVCAHELGHDTLHRELSIGGIRESTMFLSNNKTEREANLFAADMLLTDKAVISELEYNNEPETAAYNLNVPIELLEYKLEILSYKGYNVNYLSVRNDFLK
ncbi:MAG: ImmA/IrrE family metallo-endopeptidase [Clostridia bacterium]|nr:ImmA/IrrE family metallo-endopeptidase [Clostridia bacterium]